MKKIDLSIQALFFLAGIVGLISIKHGGIFFLLYAQLFLGGYNLISLIIRTIRIPQNREKINKLLFYCWIFLGIGAFSLFIASLEQWFDFEWLLATVWIALPWSIAAFYFYISCIDTFPKKLKQSSFLPHIEI